MIFTVFAVCGFCGSVKKSSKSNAVFAIFGLDWFDLQFYFWIGSDTITSRLVI
jgi:hypothetical protein